MVMAQRTLRLQDVEATLCHERWHTRARAWSQRSTVIFPCIPSLPEREASAIKNWLLFYLYRLTPMMAYIEITTMRMIIAVKTGRKLAANAAHSKISRQNIFTTPSSACHHQCCSSILALNPCKLPLVRVDVTAAHTCDDALHVFKLVEKPKNPASCRINHDLVCQSARA